MKTFCLIFCLFSVSVALDCPNPADIPVVDERTGNYTAALVFQGPGHQFPFQACNGPKLTYVDKDRVAGEGPAEFFEVGSLIVKAGCKFFGFSESEFSGKSLVVRGPVVLPQGAGYDYTLGHGFRSWYTECAIHYINCVPEDKFEIIFACDNTDGLVDLNCTYTRTIGTSYSTEISDSMNIDSTIEASLTSSFFGLFETTLSTSVTTGYDWGSVSSEAKQSEETFEVAALAPAGTSVLFEQTVGYCDSSRVKTDMFKVSHQNKNGEIIKTDIVYGGN